MIRSRGSGCYSHGFNSETKIAGSRVSEYSVSFAADSGESIEKPRQRAFGCAVLARISTVALQAP
jgi:hypothetical protein